MTGTHPFWSADRQAWIKAADLQIGEQVKTQHGITTLTDRIEVVGEQTVYNLEVYQVHNYLVSDVGVLVHNSYVNRAIKEIQNGKTEVHVKTRQQAEEIFRELFVGQKGKHYPNNSDGLMMSEADKFYPNGRYYHWDEKFGSDGLLENHSGTGKNAHHATKKHLQVHLEGGDRIYIFFEN